MKELTVFFADWLKGKPIFPVASRIISALFCVSISSFIFEKTYFEYTWLDISDYKNILNFFIKGNFFIPFSLFIIVYGFTYIFSLVLFVLINRRKIEKLERKIMNYELNNKNDKKPEDLEKVSRVKSSENLRGSWIIEIYKALKARINPQLLNRFILNLEKRKMK